jgi:heme exporter protein B
MAVFAFLTLVVFQLAFAPDPSLLAAWGSGAIWASLLFAGVLGFARAFATERERGTLDGLLLAPVDRSLLYLGKLAGSFGLMAALAAVAVPLAGVLFNLPVLQPAVAAAILFGSFAFATLGTLFSAVTANLRAREFLLPILLLPLAVPVVIAAAGATADALNGAAGSSGFPWLGLLAAFGAIMLALSLALFEYAIEE